MQIIDKTGQRWYYK